MSYDERFKTIEQIDDLLRNSIAWTDVLVNQFNIANTFKNKLLPTGVLCAEALNQSAKLIAKSGSLGNVGDFSRK